MPYRRRKTGETKLLYRNPEIEKVCLEALENAGYQIGTDFVLLYEVERVYETRIDCSMKRLAAA